MLQQNTIVFVSSSLSLNSDFVHFHCERFQSHCPHPAKPKLRKNSNLPAGGNINRLTSQQTHTRYQRHFTELALLDRCLWTFTVPSSEKYERDFFVWMMSSSSFIPDLWSSTLGQSWPELENTRAHMLSFQFNNKKNSIWVSSPSELPRTLLLYEITGNYGWETWFSINVWTFWTLA